MSYGSLTRESLYSRLSERALLTSDELIKVRGEVRPDTTWKFTYKGEYKKAAVLLLIFEQDGELYFPFIRRTSQSGDKHSGQIALPGGRIESTDKTSWTAAVREAHEEIGIDPLLVKPITTLHDVEIPASGYIVTPHVGIYEENPKFSLQEQEVKTIYLSPVQKILDPTVMKKKDIEVRGYTLPDVPYFELAGQVVWGATAAILAEFKAMLE